MLDKCKLLKLNIELQGKFGGGKRDETGFVSINPLSMVSSSIKIILSLKVGYHKLEDIKKAICQHQ